MLWTVCSSSNGASEKLAPPVTTRSQLLQVLRPANSWLRVVTGVGHLRRKKLINRDREWSEAQGLGSEACERGADIECNYRFWSPGANYFQRQLLRSTIISSSYPNWLRIQARLVFFTLPSLPMLLFPWGQRAPRAPREKKHLV